jgi:hypothetical protein
MSEPWRKLGLHLASLKFPQLTSCLETSASEAFGLLGVVAEVFRVAEKSRLLGVLSLAVLSLGQMAPAAEANGHHFRSGSTGTTRDVTLENMPVGGLIHSTISQCGWTW